MSTSPAHDAPLADLANQDFTTEPDRPDGQRAVPPGRYVIGLAADGVPVTLAAVSPEGAGRQGPAVVVSGAATLEEVVESSPLLNLLELNPDAAVVTSPGSGSVHGVLERATIDAYVRQDHFPGGPARTGVGAATGEDGCLCGAHRTPHAHVICAFDGCGHVNQLHFYDPDDPPLCSGPGDGVPEHPLTLSSQRR